MKKIFLNKFYKILLIINTSLFIISFSISFVIMLRPFYYYHINYLELEKKTNYTSREIAEAYDDVMDYLVFNKEFKTGKLRYSWEGESHFKDCKLLFLLNFIVLGITSLVLIIRKFYLKEIKIKKHSISYWSSILVLSSFIIILVTSFIVGFEKCFDAFHNIFFLGKNNWLLNSNTDEIINILPQEYFMNCAILVISMISIISTVIIVREIVSKRKV